MATADFKSTSRSGAAEPKAAKPQPSLRRSHSINAVSRETHISFEDSNSISVEFPVRRDNPLFCTSSSSSRKEEEEEEGATLNNGGFKQSSYPSNDHLNGGSSSGSGSELRGRSVTRSGGVRNGIGRSLSRVRGWSLLRAHDKGVYESEIEVDAAVSTNARSRNTKELINYGMNRSHLIRNRVDTRSSVKSAGSTTIKNREIEWSEDESAFSMKISHLGDSISTDSLSESDDTTVKATSQYLNDFRSYNTSIITATDVPDIPQDLVNPISNIKREYVIKLQQSEERARKSRIDLAIEERRGKELDRILKEIISDSKTSSSQKSRRGRRLSNERKRMSNRLSEEAMAYFDECVSLSTFDSSDFSAAEDPPYSSVAATTAIGTSSFLKGSPSTLSCYDECSDPHQKQVLRHGIEDSGTSINKSSSKPGAGTQSYQFSFADKQPENESIRSYMKHFERGAEKDVDLASTRSYYDSDEYNKQNQFESVFIDKVLYMNRIESGGLFLCEGCAISILPLS